ncbi:hypothetical protein [Pseudobutyrivibrio xylanivorans]|nr:hypothetical protein [Pseudobutyrivibrio xylanivorans]
MKTWENAAVEEIEFTATKEGGVPSRRFDNHWFDENGAEHVNFES